MNAKLNRFNGPRGQLIKTLFPAGVPRLWCPTLTHYTDGARLDPARLGAHLRALQPWVKGFLIPGSTGKAGKCLIRKSANCLRS